MPKMTTELSTTYTINGAGTFTFSGARPAALQEAEYTLVTIVVDETGSVRDFADDLLLMLKNVVSACKYLPNAANVLVRATAFSTRPREIHGFRALQDIEVEAYSRLRPSGQTALYDAVLDAIGATQRYAAELEKHLIESTGVVYIITDGEDLVSKATPTQIAMELSAALQAETLLDLRAYLIGINTTTYEQTLQSFKVAATLSEYIDAGTASPETLARVSSFVSKSIRITSATLPTGGANTAAPLVF